MKEKFFDEIGMDGLSDGDICSLEITNIHTDWESGIVDDWDLEFVKHESI